MLKRFSSGGSSRTRRRSSAAELRARSRPGFGVVLAAALAAVLGGAPGHAQSTTPTSRGGPARMGFVPRPCEGPILAGPILAAGRSPDSVAIGDLDGDGDEDLAVANYYGDDVSVLLNEGRGTFATQVTYPVGDGPTAVSIADLDGDGDRDLAVANWAYPVGSASVLLNQGGGTFATSVTCVTGGLGFS